MASDRTWKPWCFVTLAHWCHSQSDRSFGACSQALFSSRPTRLSRTAATIWAEAASRELAGCCRAGSTCLNRFPLWLTRAWSASGAWRSSITALGVGPFATATLVDSTWSHFIRALQLTRLSAASRAGYNVCHTCCNVYPEGFKS
jgi:hypothetical protein